MHAELAIFWAVNSPPSVATRQLPIYCVDRDDNVVAISFDDVILRQFYCDLKSRWENRIVV